MRIIWEMLWYASAIVVGSKLAIESYDIARQVWLCVLFLVEGTAAGT